MNLSMMNSLDQKPDSVLSYLIDILQGEKILDLVKPGCIDKCVSRYLFDEEDSLVEWNVLERKPSVPRWTRFVHLFKVPKSNGKESRLIGNCTPLNVSMPPPPPMGLPPMDIFIEKLLSGHWLFQLDGTAYFYQFPLGQTLSELLGVRMCRIRGDFSEYAWKVMPMGWTYAPAIAQRTSNLLCANAEHNLEGSIMPWVDNFLFSAPTEEKMDLLIQSFRKTAGKVNMEYTEGSHPAKTMEALGLLWDVSDDDIKNHNIRPSTKNLEKMKVTLDAFICTPTHRSMYKVFGSLIWVIYTIARLPLCLWTHVMNQVRHSAKQISLKEEDWDDPIIPSEQLLEEFRVMMHISRQSTLTLSMLLPQTPDITCSSDASGGERKGWGMTSRDEKIISAAWGAHEFTDIYLAELLTACNLWSQHSERIPNLHIDNTGANNTILKGHSRSPAGDLIMKRLYETLPEEARAYTTWVPTDCQQADMLSRGKWIIPNMCGHAHETARIRWRVRKSYPADHKNGGNATLNVCLASSKTQTNSKRN